MVTYLGYECYESMALHQMNKLCQLLCSKYTDLVGLAVFHRIGNVPVGETSLLIVAVSPHRRSAIDAMSECIDLVKMKVPIWKKEHYEDGPALDETLL